MIFGGSTDTWYSGALTSLAKIAGVGAALPTECTTKHSADPGQCIYANESLPFVKTPYDARSLLASGLHSSKSASSDRADRVRPVVNRRRPAGRELDRAPGAGGGGDSEPALMTTKQTCSLSHVFLYRTALGSLRLCLPL